MGLLGGIIGGGIGFLLGGPLGLIFGSALGANVENANKRAQAHPGARVNGSPQAAQQAFLVAMISLAAKVAKADGRVTSDEVRSFDGFLRDQLRMPARECKVAARVFNEAKDSPIPAEEFARQVRQLLGHQPDRMRDIISLLMMIAMADGRLHQAEEAMIRSIALEMGLNERDFQEAKAMFNPTANLDAAYATLGLPSGATDGEVKGAYRRLAKEYHPDVLANKGMSDDFIKFAGDKMQAVNAAYDVIKKERGF